MHEENWREESIHKLLKLIDHFEEDQVVKARTNENICNRFEKNNLTIGNTICLSTIFIIFFEVKFD
jgi:hypothetical protein